MIDRIFTNAARSRIAVRIVAVLVVAGACGYALTHLEADGPRPQQAGRPATAAPAPNTATAGRGHRRAGIAAENRAYEQWVRGTPTPAKGQQYGAFSPP